MHILYVLRSSKNKTKQQQLKTIWLYYTPSSDAPNMASLVILLFIYYLSIFYLLCGNLVYSINLKVYIRVVEAEF